MNATLSTWISDQLEDLKRQSLYKPMVILDSPCEARITVNGRADVINLASNNYLGLANDPRLKASAIAAVEKYGAGAGAVRPITGNLRIHSDLEERLARFKHVEAAIVFQSGFTANAGTIPTLITKDDAIISDQSNHASIIDGCRLAGLPGDQRPVYAHLDMDSLEACLKACARYAKRLIITDGVFSMDGDIAPLPAIVALSERYDAAIMVDDAHGSGVLGGGRGTAYHFGLQDRIDIQLGTLSKAIGVVGGYIAGRRPLIDWLQQRSRPFLFSTAPPPAAVGAILAALDIMESDASLVDRLWDNASYWKEGLHKLGFDTGTSETPITPVMLGDESAALRMQGSLLEEGVLALAIVYPTVPRGRARLRTMPSAMHSRADLDEALEAFRRCG